MSRHAAAAPARRDRRSTRTSSDLATTGSPAPAGDSLAPITISAAEIIARLRTPAAVPATAVPPTAAPAPATLAAPVAIADPNRPLTAAQIIARHRSLPDGAADPIAVASRRRHAAQVERARRLPSLARPIPVKVIVRPVIGLAAIVAVVAAFDATQLTQSKATSINEIGPIGLGQPESSAPSASPSPAGSSSSAPPAGATASSAADSTPTRVSRDKRVDIPPTPLMKPGQTVPGVWVLPNPGPMTSCFCMRWGTMHWGIDLAGPLGSPILAAGDGTVIAAGPADGFGNWVVIQHDNGDVSIYGHMRYFYVQVGQHVTAGDKIAVVGAEGQATGPHLHFEVHKGGLNGPKLDPVPWLKDRGVTVGPYDPNG